MPAQVHECVPEALHFATHDVDVLSSAMFCPSTPPQQLEGAAPFTMAQSQALPFKFFVLPLDTDGSTQACMGHTCSCSGVRVRTTSLNLACSASNSASHARMPAVGAVGSKSMGSQDSARVKTVGEWLQHGGDTQ